MRSWSVAGRVFGVQILAFLMIGAVLLVILFVDVESSINTEAAATGLAVSRTIASDSAVKQALLTPDPTTPLQPYALSIMKASHVDFVTIMSPDGIRYTHPDPAEIGNQFLGTISEAQQGRTITETYTGTLGPSVRAVVPIMQNGKLIGIVSAGVTTKKLSSQVWPRIPFLIGIALLIVAFGTVAAAFTQRSLRRITAGLRPVALEQMVQFYESVLHSVREGVILTDAQRRVVLYNDEAADLLGLPPASAQRESLAPSELEIAPEIAGLLETGRRVLEETHVADGRILLINQEPAASPGRTATQAHSAVMTLRDQSQLRAVVGELDTARTMSEALQSQFHEHANRLHTIVSLIAMGRTDEVVDLIRNTTRTSQALADAVWEVRGDPVLTALLLGKSATAAERGIQFEISIDANAELPLSGHETVSFVGNLIDNAFDAVRATPQPHQVRIVLKRSESAVTLEVTDSGPGFAARESVFEPGFTTKPADGTAHGFGLTVVRQILDSHRGSFEILAGPPTTIVVTLPRDNT